MKNWANLEEQARRATRLAVCVSRRSSVVEVLHVECLLQIRVGHVEEIIGGLSHCNNSRERERELVSQPKNVPRIWACGVTVDTSVDV